MKIDGLEASEYFEKLYSSDLWNDDIELLTYRLNKREKEKLELTLRQEEIDCEINAIKNVLILQKIERKNND